MAVSDFLEELFNAKHIVKAGFELHGDVKYLCRAFPHMPCFQEPFLGEVMPPAVQHFDSMGEACGYLAQVGGLWGL